MYMYIYIYVYVYVYIYIYVYNTNNPCTLFVGMNLCATSWPQPGWLGICCADPGLSSCVPLHPAQCE